MRKKKRAASTPTSSRRLDRVMMSPARLDMRTIGVRLTDSFVMLPMKSVSGVYFPTEHTFASCQLCPRDDCPGRSAPYDPKLWKERYAEGSEGS